MIRHRRVAFGGVLALAVMAFAASTFAASAIVVTPANTQGWSTADTRPGGAVNYVLDGSAPAGIGALQLTTNNTTTAKAQYLHSTNTPIANVNELSYYAKQNSASFAQGDASYQFLVCLSGTFLVNGDCAAGFTTFVFEPYQAGYPATVNNGVWQQWDVDAGQFWSSRNYSSGSCVTVNGAGGPPFYTLAQIKANCPAAVAIGFGVNIGSNNPSYDIEADLVSFNSQAYDFEPYAIAATKDDCKKDGWMGFNRADGSSFKNQGDCMQYVNTGK